MLIIIIISVKIKPRYKKFVWNNYKMPVLKTDDFFMFETCSQGIDTRRHYFFYKIIFFTKKIEIS